MIWHPDVPELPIKKPQLIEEIEQMDRAVLDSMPPAEVAKLVESAAYAIAEAYKDQNEKGNALECIEYVSIALSVTGSAIGGKVGSAMVSSATESLPRTVSELVFPEIE